MDSSLTDLVVGFFIFVYWRDFKAVIQYHGQKARYYMDKNKEKEE